MDDCCHVKNLYEHVFPGVKLRLDIFHACSRVLQTIPKSDSARQQFSKEFSLIFRRNGDLGEERTMSTPDPDEIEANLERLLFVWRQKLTVDTIHQIENLRKHIQKGCLSDIPVACGTEKNERLHRHLNRSLLCGVSKIGPELAIAIMTCALYAWNCKRKGKTLQSKRTVPIPPIEVVSSRQVLINSQKHMKTVQSTTLSSQSCPSALSAKSATDRSAAPPATSHTGLPNSVEDMKNDTFLSYILQRVLHYQDFFNIFTDKCKNKALDMIACLWSQNVTLAARIEEESKLNDIGTNMAAQHRDNLVRNLSGFDLEVDEIAKDGNCFFRATVRQLHNHLRKLKEQIQPHIDSLGLGKSEQDDSERLRNLFVQELKENFDEYREWMSGNAGHMLTEIDLFARDGYFASEVGDICARATAKLLQIPIVLVTALPTVPTIPFIPDEFVTTEPIYIAYDHSGPGHYDATKGMIVLIEILILEKGEFYFGNTKL